MYWTLYPWIHDCRGVYTHFRVSLCTYSGFAERWHTDLDLTVYILERCFSKPRRTVYILRLWSDKLSTLACLFEAEHAHPQHLKPSKLQKCSVGSWAQESKSVLNMWASPLKAVPNKIVRNLFYIVFAKHRTCLPSVREMATGLQVPVILECWGSDLW